MGGGGGLDTGKGVRGLFSDENFRFKNFGVSSWTCLNLFRCIQETAF